MRWPKIKRGPGTLYRKWASLRFLWVRDRDEVLRFLRAPLPMSTPARLALIWRFVHITNHVRAYHTQAELLRVARAILARPGPITVVEAGAAKGASTAKLSLLVRAVGGTLHVFDSFKGIPDNEEVHRNHDGRTVRFSKGAFLGRIGAVKRAVERYGAPEVCIYHRGWFAETLPQFSEPVDVALLDVDLWSSTRECIQYLYPLLKRDGVMFSQDGHLSTITERLSDPWFWSSLGIEDAELTGVGTDKLLELRRRPTLAG